jgi:hypothetical protein
VLDKAAGPGHTAAEWALFGATSMLAVAALAIAAKTGTLAVQWSLGQLLTACFLALNVGFVVIIACGASKRWYHRGRGVTGGALALVLGDGVFQLALTNGVFAWGDWRYITYLGLYFVLGGSMLPRLRLHLQRPAGLLLCFGGVLLALYVAPPITGLEWFPIVFFLKYFVAHIPREEPYRPCH